ncbi:hypothetical protein C2814_10340 [Pasteurella multocida]|nr:hypothetical protein [Pasteurella multocida]NNI23441.1 hypothetical protein [Pasteurella multocida]NNI25609.1 hypothetical protein [Pasteurella multocida]NNI60427.1 hypothetical protein [Pasteurella multocida]
MCIHLNLMIFTKIIRGFISVMYKISLSNCSLVHFSLYAKLITLSISKSLSNEILLFINLDACLLSKFDDNEYNISSPLFLKKEIQ